MKMLLVISEAPPVKSGVARVAEKLSLGLTTRGYQVDTLSLHDAPRLELGEVRLSSMPLRLHHLRQRFQEYDLIHLHGPVPTFSDVVLLAELRDLRASRPALIYTHHAPIEIKCIPLLPFTWIYNLAVEKLAHLADHVVVTTPSYGQRLRHSVPAGKLSVIPWGVDYDRFHAPLSKPGQFTVVYLGQIRPYKGLPVLLKAASGLSGIRLWVIGDGHYSAKSKALAERLDLPDLTFWGALPDDEMVNLLKCAHVIVLPSVTRSEAFGIALLEGMAAGLVPVASYLPGVADVVGNEGITFPPGDHLALRAALTRLRDDRALCHHLASLAQAKARLYPWERVVFGYERIFNRYLASPVSERVLSSTDIPTQPILQGYSD